MWKQPPQISQILDDWDTKSIPSQDVFDGSEQPAVGWLVATSDPMRAYVVPCRPKLKGYGYRYFLPRAVGPSGQGACGLYYTHVISDKNMKITLD